MVSIMALWMPILLAAVLVFIASSVIHMMLGYHNNDFRAVPNEDAVQAALRPFNIPAGDYMLPKPANMAASKAPAFQEKLKAGPVAVLTVFPGGDFKMGTSLILWFVYSIVISVFAAYVAGRALAPGADYLAVFRFAGVTAFLGYAGAIVQASIWMKKAWSTTLIAVVDGLVYGLVTGGAFGWLWPSA